MAGLTNKERLQPSLLDRLTDDAPGQSQESCDQRVLSMRSLRKAVLRDLGWLLNSTRLECVQDLTELPLTLRSVLNFGLPDLSGKTATGLDPLELGRRIHQTIEDFEPRILRGTLRVTPIPHTGVHAGPSQVVFEIHGELWGQPLPERLHLKTELDLEVGNVRLYDIDAGGAR